MNLENEVKDVISQKLTDGTIEKLIGEHVEKGVSKVLESLFSSYGDASKVIEKELKSVMIPYLERYDYSQYLVKLDAVLVDVLKNTNKDNNKMLENFKDLMIVEEMKNEIEVSELFHIWKEHVAENVETDNLEVVFDDGPSYEYVEVTLEIEEKEGREWSSYEDATLYMECEHDEEMNFEVSLHRWKDSSDKGWRIDYGKKHSMDSLRYLGKLDILMMKLMQNGTKIILDITSDSDSVMPEKEPEATFG